MRASAEAPRRQTPGSGLPQRARHAVLWALAVAVAASPLLSGLAPPRLADHAGAQVDSTDSVAAPCPPKPVDGALGEHWTPGETAGGQTCELDMSPCVETQLPSALRGNWLQLRRPASTGSGLEEVWLNAVYMLSSLWPHSLAYDPPHDPLAADLPPEPGLPPVAAGFCEMRMFRHEPIYLDFGPGTECIGAKGLVHIAPHPGGEPRDVCLMLADPALIAECDSARGFVELETAYRAGSDSADDPVCRRVAPAQCPAGTNHISPNSCVMTQRRGWLCLASFYEPGNAWGSCIRDDTGGALVAPPVLPGSHPCDAGVLALVDAACRHYVGTDWYENPATAPRCVDYPRGAPLDPALRLVAATNPHWCAYDARYLLAECHSAGSSSSCIAPIDSMCLKRAASTGGCESVGRSLLCNSLVAAGLTAEELAEQGCQPCRLRPFRPQPSGCPTSLSAGLAKPNRYAKEHLLVQALEDSWAWASWNCSQLRYDALDGSGQLAPDFDPEIHNPDNGGLYPGCRDDHVCAPPPSGNVTWQASHFTGLSVVNAPTVFEVIDAPTVEKFDYLRLTSALSAPTPQTGYRLRYADSSQHQPLAAWTPVAPGTSKHGFGDYNWSYGDFTIACHYSTASSYLAGDLYPSYRVKVRELWPDNDADRDEMEALFGPGVLSDWWDLLDPPERVQLTEARGLRYWGGLDSAERDDERDRRSQQLVEFVECNYGSDVWCRWTPRRSGYFSASLGSSWVGTRHTPPSWKRPPIPTCTGCKDAIRDWLTRTFPHMSLDDAANMIGLASDLSSYLTYAATGTSDIPIDYLNGGSDARANADALYQLNYNGIPTALCPRPLDVRVDCSGTSYKTVSYVESPAVGVAVYEVSVQTTTARAY